MSRRISFFFFLLISLLSSEKLFAQEEVLLEGFKEFKLGNYTQTLEVLQSFKTKDEKLQATKDYLEGVARSRIQEFDLAAESLTKAGMAGHDAQDLYYELGQALYADNQLEKARAAFIRSNELGYMSSSSLYYMGNISQLLYENDKAVVYFDEILQKEQEDLRLRQIARFQRAEAMLLMAEEKPGIELKNLVEQTLLPQLRRALEEDRKSNIVSDIQVRIVELQEKFGLDPDKMINGRTMSRKRLNFFISQKILSDDNVTLANDQPTVQTVKEGSLISDTTASVDYSWYFLRKFGVTPGLRIQNIHHFERNIPEVYRNDRYSLMPSIRNRYEHTFFGKMASALFDITYDYTAQDKLATQEKSYFSRSLTYSFGQRVKIFDIGDTTLRFRIKKYEAYTENLNNDTFGFSLDQIAILPNSHLLVATFNYDNVDNYNNPSASTASTTLRADYIINNIRPLWNLDFSLSYNALDTKEQSSTRGTEVTLSPSFKITRKLFNKYRLMFRYAYNSKSSESVNFEYQKNVATFELRYDF